MVELSAGKKLSDARLQRGLSIDAAAHATKMRPDKILALENDDYTRFGNIAYAKSFLLMYSKFLGVDVSEQSRDLDHRGNRLSIEEYQYLNHAPEPKAPETAPTRRERRERKPPSVLPLLVFAMLCAGGLGWMYYHANAPRLELDKTTVSASPAPDSEKTEEATSATVTAKEAPAPKVSVAPAVAVPAEAPAPVAVPVRAAVPVAPAAANLAPQATVAFAKSAAVIPPPAVRESDSALLERELTERAAAEKRPVSPQPEKDKVQIVPLRRTWVTVRQPGPDAPIKFEGVIYPEAQPLNVPTPAFIVVQDQTAVRIQRGGQPIAYQAPGISVQ